MNSHLKVGALIAVNFGYEIYLKLKDKIQFSFIIGLKKPKDLDNVSGYINIKKFLRSDPIDCYLASSYSLTDKRDMNNIIKREIDVLLVLGWQRLVPDWLLKHVKIATIGIHGSPFGITKGRGRSPQNWALIMGCTDFYLSLFQIDKGIDSGNILMEKKFSYSVFDDIYTSYLKCVILVSDMILELFENMEAILKAARCQTDEPEYFPARKPEDGGIDWNLTSFQIYNIIRALTMPYPGAFTYHDYTKIKIWEAVPFECPYKEVYRFKNGEILECFSSGKFLVKCGDGLILVKRWESDSPWEPKRQQILKSIPMDKTLENIILRHKSKYPNLKINNQLLNFYNNIINKTKSND